MIPHVGVKGQVELYESLLKAQSDIGEGVAIIDMATGRFLYANEALCVMYGYSYEELLELRSMFELVAPEVRPELIDRFARRRGGEQVPSHYETVVVHKDGHRVPIEVSVVTVGAGVDTRLIALVRDLSARRRAEEELARLYTEERRSRLAAERANEELESFTFTVSHDLANPLLSVLGYVDLLRREHGEHLGEEGRTYLERIASNAAYMQSLIEDLLELSRVGRLQTETEALDLLPLLSDIAREIKVSYPGLRVEVGPLPVVDMNPVRARQLFTNLIGNAAEHGGRPRLTVEVAGEEGAGGSARIWVADDGRGIPEDHRHRIFRAFERPGKKAGQRSGTGIGLAVCKKIVESCGGSIWAADAARGARIEMTLPASVVHSFSGGRVQRTV